MKFSANFVEGTRNAALEERGTVAKFQIFISEQNVTMHFRGTPSADHATIDHVTVPLYGIAEGIVHDWWKLFGGRDQEISLIKYRSGFLVPDVRFSFDGVAFEVWAQQRAYKNPDVRFWIGPAEIMARTEAENALSTLVQEVIDQLDKNDIRGTSAALRWARIQESRADRDEAIFCESAGALGLDPYQIADDKAAIIERAASMFSEREPLDEFLSGAQLYPANSIMDWIEHAESRPRYKSLFPDLKGVAEQAMIAAPPIEGERSWALGYKRARAVRKAMNLTAGHRFGSVKKMAKAFGASDSFSSARHVNGIRALRKDESDQVFIHLRDHGNTAAQSRAEFFSLARAVGDAACFPASSRASINELHSAYRQAAGRAFAAEFLAPIDEIKSMQADGRDRISIEEDFAVSGNVIEHQLENALRISLACAG